MSGDCCVALPCGAMGLYAALDCGISLSYSLTTVADPGPLMLGVLDRWTPTVNVLQTLIAQIIYHIELCPIEAKDSISLYTTPLSYGQKICLKKFSLL